MQERNSDTTNKKRLQKSRFAVRLPAAVKAKATNGTEQNGANREAEE